MAHTDLSVIIPTLNAGPTLEKQLHLIKGQQIVPVDIIIADSGSTDQTVAIAKSIGAAVLMIEPGQFDHGATRNLTASKARGDILIFMTQDALPINNQLFTRLIDPLLQDHLVALSYARQLAQPGASLSEQYLRLANYPNQACVKTQDDFPTKGIKTYFCSNACAAYNHKLFKTLGGFREPIVCNEDMIFSAQAIKAGYKVAYAADALIMHTHHLNSQALFKRYFDISASLDHEPQIRNLGALEANGLGFLKQQLHFTKTNGSAWGYPKVMFEASAKYMGFKAGQYHKYIPGHLKKHLGANKLYWSKLASAPVNKLKAD